MILTEITIKRFFLILLLVIITSTLKAQDSINVQGNYKCLLYLPKDYAAEKKKYPLMIYLGGGSQRGTDLNKLKTFGPPALISAGRDFNFIIVSPQCPEGKTWTSENWFESLFASLLSDYRIDTNRIYVTGISIGGFGTWQAAINYPDKFAAIIPLCGGVNDIDTLKIPKINQCAIWAFHGSADDIIPIEETARVYRKLRPYNSKMRFTILNGKGHAIQYLYEDRRIYRWMLKQKRH